MAKHKKKTHNPFSVRRAVAAEKQDADGKPIKGDVHIAAPLEHGFGGHLYSGFADNDRRQRVPINSFDPCLEEAARACGVAYGKTYVGGCAGNRFSSELNFSNDRSGFLTADEAFDERERARVLSKPGYVGVGVNA